MNKPIAVTPRLLKRHPPPAPGGDKNARGSIFVVGGSAAMPASVVLPAIAALRAGAGKLQVGTCASFAVQIGFSLPEALLVALPETKGGGIAPRGAGEIVKHANDCDALVLGPGMDEEGCTTLTAAVMKALRVPAILDAAALACFARDNGAARRSGAVIVLTPHAGEMAHMLGLSRERIERDPATHAVRAAKRFHAVVALKGEDTYVAAPDGRLYCNRSGNAGLATSGSGDALAGIIGGFLARGLDALHAALWGVYLHAAAGDALARRVGVGFLAREIPGEIPAIMKRLSSSR